MTVVSLAAARSTIKVPTVPPLEAFLPTIERNNQGDRAQNLTFAREGIETARCIAINEGEKAIAATLAFAIEQIDGLALPPVLPLGCWRCGGDVPADVPELAQDRICHSCAVVFDAAVAARKAALKEARQVKRRA